MIFTIDSCLPMALKESQSCHDLKSIQELFEASLVGRVKLQLSTAFERDRLRTKGDLSKIERAAALGCWILNQPLEPNRIGGAFRLDVSDLGGEDLICDEGVEALDQNLKSLIFKENSNSTEFDRLYSDIDHLLAHHLSNNDSFVTLDNKTIYKFRNQLATYGIEVLTPAEAVQKLK